MVYWRMIRSYPKAGTQADRILRALLKADGEWISGSYFLREMLLSQYHARIWDLEQRFNWTIEHSEAKDSYGFLSYKITKDGQKHHERSVAKPDIEYVEIDGIMHARLKPPISC